MKFSFFITLSLFQSLFIATVYGQGTNLIITREQNNRWLDSVKVLQIENQLIAIKNRLCADTNIFIRQSYNDGIKSRFNIVDSLGNRVYGDGKPTLVIGGYAMIIDNKTQSEKIVRLTKLLNQSYMKEIFILSPNDPATTALYGTPQFGIIVMTVQKKKYAKLFKRLELKPNY